MKQRCSDKTQNNYKYYGGRGIIVCHQWQNDFEQFLKDVGRCPSPELSLDRFPNPDGNYEPGNVRWATDSEQQKNKRKRPSVTNFAP